MPGVERWHCVSWQHPDSEAAIHTIEVVSGPADPLPTFDPNLPVNRECGPWGLTRDGGYVHGRVAKGDLVSGWGNVVHVTHGAMVEVPEPGPMVSFFAGIGLLIVIAWCKGAIDRWRSGPS